MNHRIKTFAFAVTTMTLATINTASAGGHGRIAGLVIGIARNHISSSRTPSRVLSSRHHAPSYPTHHTQVPVVRSQPVYSQPVQSQMIYSQPSMPSRPATVVSMNPVSSIPPTVLQTSGSMPQLDSMPISPSSADQSPTSLSVATTPPSAGTADSTEISALQMLASITGEEGSTETVAAQIPEFTAAASPGIAGHVGTWTVALPDNEGLVLTLNDDGTFAWDATKAGKSSSFEGQYHLEDGRLTLVRSNDLQQMAGSWIGTGASFTFTLDGATNSGLAFVRN